MENKKCYYFFDGYYAVAAVSDMLKRYHIGNRIVRAPVSIQNSCNFAVLVKADDAEMISLLLEQNGVCMKGKECM